jgi:hypothetical protein
MRAAQAQAAAQASMYEAGYAAASAGGGGAAGVGGYPPGGYPQPSPAAYGWYAPSPPGPVLGSPVLVAPPSYQVAAPAAAPAPAAAAAVGATSTLPKV